MWVAQSDEWGGGLKGGEVEGTRDTTNPQSFRCILFFVLGRINNVDGCTWQIAEFSIGNDGFFTPFALRRFTVKDDPFSSISADGDGRNGIAHENPFGFGTPPTTALSFTDFRGTAEGVSVEFT